MRLVARTIWLLVAALAVTTTGLQIARADFEWCPDGADWFVDDSNAGTEDGSMANPFNTIAEALTAASPGDTICVADGTYNAVSVVQKDGITLLGRQHGVDARNRSAVPESIISNVNGGFGIQANNVTIDGFTVTGVASDNMAIYQLGNFSGGKILNNIITGNIFGISLASNGTNQTVVQYNDIHDNSVAGPASGHGIYSDAGLINALIDNNTFKGHSVAAIAFYGGDVGGTDSSNVTISNNTFDGDRVLLFGGTSGFIFEANLFQNGTSTSGSLRFAGSVESTNVTCNTMTGGVGPAIRIDKFGTTVINTGITINKNNISGYTAGLQVDTGGYSGTLDATQNFWGAANGPNPPGSGQAIVDPDGVVNAIPFLNAQLGPNCELPPPPQDGDDDDDDDDDDHRGAAPSGQPAAIPDTTGAPTRPPIILYGGPAFFTALVINGQHVLPGAIGDMTLIQMGIVQAADVFTFLPDGTIATVFNPPVRVCMLGQGTIFFRPASDMTGTFTPIPSFPDGTGYTCADLTVPGVAVLVGTPTDLPAGNPSAVNGASTPLTNCRVTTTHAVRIRTEPNTSSNANIIDVVPFGLTLQATERVDGWIKVIYEDGQGYISDDYLETIGDCG